MSALGIVRNNVYRVQCRNNQQNKGYLTAINFQQTFWGKSLKRRLLKCYYRTHTCTVPLYTKKLTVPSSVHRSTAQNFCFPQDFQGLESAPSRFSYYSILGYIQGESVCFSWVQLVLISFSALSLQVFI